MVFFWGREHIDLIQQCLNPYTIYQTRSDIGCGSDLLAVETSGYCIVRAPVPLSGRFELLLVQTGQKGQAGRFS